MMFMLTVTGLVGIALLGHAVKDEIRVFELVLGIFIVLTTAFLTNQY